ncbi:MAG: hypothetical protein ACKVQW_14340, partial [Pyrinomonadaceae bacterium]
MPDSSKKNRNIAGVTPVFIYTENGILGSEEFVDEMIHRIGEFDARAAALRRKAARESADVNFRALLDAVEAVCGIPREDICGRSKSAKKVFAKEILIIVGRQLGASVTDLSHTTGLTSASISRRHDIACHNQKNNPDFSSIVESVRQKYAALSC